MKQNTVLAIALVVASLAVYAPVTEFEFVNFDDNVYVTENPAVLGGLSLRGVAWAFTSGHAANWHPITWLSHMFDVSLFGLDAGRHHAMNLLFHLANTLLLFTLLLRTTGRGIASAAVALFFAVHPVHVESVAWISERKDVLSGFFALASLHAYASFTATRKRRDYALLLVLFALGLMSKPMLVTLPFVMLLLDFWPLDRLHGSGSRESLRDLIVEKGPLFGLSLVSSIVTVSVQRNWGAMEIGHAIALPERLANALVSYARYLGKTFWPSDLSLLYPHPYAPGGLPWTSLQIVGAGCLLALLTVVVCLTRRHRPWLVGWFWFIGMLVPVIGIVQVGGQAMADRYAYLPSIGLFIALVFGSLEWADRHPLRRTACLSLVVVSGFASIAIARSQTEVWRDSLSLLGHAATITPGNPIIDNHLGAALQARGRYDEAIRHYRRALQYEPNNPKTLSNLGRTVQLTGRSDEAISLYREAIELAPDYLHAIRNLGAALASQGRYAEAIKVFERALELDPRAAATHANLATVFRLRGDHDAAQRIYRVALAIEPRSPTTHHGLGLTLLASGRREEAIPHFEQALQLQPDFADARAALAAARRAGNRNP